MSDHGGRPPNRRARLRRRFRREGVDAVEEAGWLGGCCALDACLTLGLAGVAVPVLARLRARRVR